MSTSIRHITAEELLKLPDEGFRYELVEGELRQVPFASHDEGRIAMDLAVPLGAYVQSRELGRVYAAGTGFRLASDPDTVRAPDIAFIRKERVEQAGRSRGFWQGPPDLAVEVTSPDDRLGEVEEKIAGWLAAGTLLVWLVNPMTCTVAVHRAGSEIQTLDQSEMLDGGDIVPGFEYSVSELFKI